MFPSLRGTISGGGPAPPDEVILDLMGENRGDWDPAAERASGGHVERADAPSPGDPPAGEAAAPVEAETAVLLEELRDAIDRADLDTAVRMAQLFKAEHRQGVTTDLPLEKKAVEVEAPWLRRSEAQQRLVDEGERLWRLAQEESFDTPQLLHAQPASAVVALCLRVPPEAAARLLRDLSIEPDRRIEDLGEGEQHRLADLLGVAYR